MSGMFMITAEDRCELRLFEMFLRRRNERPDEAVTHAYAEIYGEVVYEAPDEKGGDT